MNNSMWPQRAEEEESGRPMKGGKGTQKETSSENVGNLLRAFWNMVETGFRGTFWNRVETGFMV